MRFIQEKIRSNIHLFGAGDYRCTLARNGIRADQNRSDRNLRSGRPCAGDGTRQTSYSGLVATTDRPVMCATQAVAVLAGNPGLNGLRGPEADQSWRTDETLLGRM